MNKAQFFSILNELRSTRSAVEFRVYAFAETDAEYARLVSTDANYPWVRYATTVVVNECWHINVTTHRSPSAMEKMVANAQRWLAEWLESIEAAHTAALVMNDEIDELAQKLADCRCYWMSEQAVINSQQNEIAQYKRDVFSQGPRVAQHIVKVIVNAKRIAKTLTGYSEIKPQPSAHACTDIPF